MKKKSKQTLKKSKIWKKYFRNYEHNFSKKKNNVGANI